MAEVDASGASGSGWDVELQGGERRVEALPNRVDRPVARVRRRGGTLAGSGTSRSGQDVELQGGERPVEALPPLESAGRSTEFDGGVEP